MTVWLELVELVSDERENGSLRDYQISVSLERDLDRGLPEKERVIAPACLHRQEPRLARRDAPGLVDVRVRTRHGQAGAGRDDLATLHRLIVDRRRRQIEPDVRALFS